MDIIVLSPRDGTWGQLGSTFSLQDIFGGVTSTVGVTFWGQRAWKQP